ncbi:hypothetical protein IM697_18235 [Streptomyces ferrugineus]|uniref:Uncharacterized protein n=1 Tax=Streptomyces ferrugineus TaxID=1413221 RepID=A0A7M2SUY1_9ACTN|nr:hypothetical protein [Streptomyces ferrugineus]QOV40166.1 hypothetical protein IM697_18235 [Streptomyces ferrugineus]
MLNRPAAAHAELQDLSDDLEVKAARRKWNPALHPRDSKGRFIETGGTVRLWGGKLARVVRALPNDRVLVQDQSGPNEFRGRRHTTSAKWVSMVARPDGTAPTDNEDKVVAEDERRTKDPRRGNGLRRDDDGDPDTPNDPHNTDDQGRPIGDDDGDGPDDDDDQPEVVDIDHLPNRLINSPGNHRFKDIAAVRRHLLQLAEHPGQKPAMATFLRHLAVEKELQATANGRLLALRDDTTRRWYLTAIGTGQRMDMAGDFKDRNEASSFAYFLDRHVRSGTGDGLGPDSRVFDFTDPNLDEVARTWQSSRGENIRAAIERARQEFDSSKKKPAAKKPAAARPRPSEPVAPAADAGSAAPVSREALKPGDRVKVTVSSSDIEWPMSTRNQPKPGTVTVEGTVAPTFSGGPGTRGAPLVDVTLTGPDGKVMVSGDTARVLRMPSQVAVSGHTDGFTPEELRADRVRVGDVIARGEFGHVVGRIDRYQGGRTFTTRNLGGRGEIDQFGTRPGDTLTVVPKARRRPEDVLRDVPDRTQQHPNSGDAKRAAARVLSDWGKVNELAEQQWPDGAPEEFRTLAQHMQNVTDTPKGTDGYQENADAMHGALTALHELDTEGVTQDLAKALHRLEEGLDDNADRFEADSRAITEKKRKRTAAESDAPKPDVPQPDAPEANTTVTLTPDEVSPQIDAVRPEGSKAPSSMDDGEIRDEIVSLMEREMANGGELSGVDRTRLRVLEAEEARRAGRKPKEEPKPKPKAPAEEPGGLFDVGPEEQQQFVADPNNPDDQADDPFGTPDMFADAEGRDTSKLRPPQSRKPMDFEEGDRFVDTQGRTHTVAEPPLRTPRGRIRVVDENGGEHFLAADRELRVLHPDEDAPEVPETDAPEGAAPSADSPAGETPEAEAPAPDAADAPSDADAPAAAEPAAAPNQVTIDHSGTGTVVRFPTPNGMVSDEEFAVLRSLGFKASRDRTQPRFFYLPSNMTLSRREDKVRRLKEWLDGRNVAYQAPEESTEKPELSEEQLEQLQGHYFAPAGTWAVTDFLPGDEVWTGRSWDTVDSIGPKNLRLQGRGPTPYDSVLARRRGGEIRTMFDEPADDGTPRPGATDPKTMRDDQIAAELAHLEGATLPEGNDPAARTVRRQVSARIHALTTARSERNFARRRDESHRRALASLVRDPAALAAKKAEQVQGRDGAPIGIVYQEKKGKWLFVDRDGRTPTSERYKTRAAAITALNKLTDARNERAGEGWKHSAWDDVQPDDTIRVPELGRSEDNRRRVVTGWSEPLEVSEIRRGDMGQVLITGRSGDEDVELEVPRTDATFGTAKPGIVPDREPSDAGDGLPWTQMTPDDFGQDERPAPTADPNAPRPTDEFGTPDLITNGTPDTPEAPGTAEGSDGPETSDTPGDETETARTVLDRLPELPPLPNLTGLSRQHKDDVRRIRGDYAKIRESLDGILAGDPPTGDAREDLRRVREQLDYVAGRLTRDLLPESDEAQSVRAGLFDLGQDLDRALAALPEREPEPQGDGPNGGTLFHPWDIRDGDLVRFDAENPADRDRSLAPYYGTFKGRAASASGDQGRTLVTYQSRRWNDDRQQWEPGDPTQHTVTMPPRGLVERFTPEQWDAWQRPGQSEDRDTADSATAPDAPIRDTSPADMTDEDIQAELEELQAWQNRHVSRTGEGPRIQGNAMLALSPVASRRGKLHEEQRNRDNARRDREKKEKKKQERAEALARAEIGKRNDDGSYPVTVDGEDAGTVSQLARKWRYTNADGQDSPDSYARRAEAVAALVRNRDVRRENADEDARREQARSEAPEGWALGDRDDVAENDVIRVPITRQDGNGRPYPVGWRQPVRVNSVSRNDNGTMVLSVSNLDGSRSDISPVFLSHPDDTFAWASDRTRPEPTPAWRHELRARMADIGDDIATLQSREGLQDPERIQRLQDLIQRVSRGETDDLQGDLRQIRDEAAWLESQFDDPDLELPYETRRTRSWATAARMKAERDLRYPDFQNTDGNADGPDNGPDLDGPNDDDRAGRAQGLFGEGMNAVGGESLPEMQELVDRLDRADSSEDRDAELRDIADRIDALAEQYELAGPQGELAADRFRRAARIARGEQDDSDERRGDDPDGQDDDRSTDGASNDGQDDDNRNEATDGGAQEGEEDEQQNDDQDDEERRQRNRDGDLDGGAADPDGEPDGGDAGTPDGDDSNDSSSGEGDGPESEDNDQDAPEGDEDDEKRRRRRRRRRDRGGNGGPGGGGPGGPGLPHLNLPDFNVPDATGDGGEGGSGSSGNRDGGRSRRSRHRDVDSLRNAWRTGEDLTAAEDTPERRSHLAELADREGLALSPEGGLAVYPEPQADGSTVWRFAQARNGTNLPGLTLTSDDPEEARTLAGRFEEITDRNGDPFDWHQPWGPASALAWRDGEGRSLPQALRAVQDDYEQERSGAFTLPEDLSTLSDPELEAAYRQGLGPDDELRVMAEMDRRDGYVDERIRAAVPDTPPADAEEAERRGRAMDEALGFGDTDVTQPASAAPGRLRREFDALDEERFQAAMEATGGRMLSSEAEAQGIDPRAVFSGTKYSNKRAKELASPELNLWIDGDDENVGHGRLTYPQYRQREADRVLRAEFADWDEARYRQAVDFTNGYFFKREYKFGALPFDERELFSGGSLSARDRWRQYASEELQEWFDNNGGRQTFAQFKQSRRDGDRRDRDLFEEEQRRAAETESGAPDDTAPFTADDVTPPPPFNPADVESEEDAAFRFGGHDRMKEFADRAELRPAGESESVWLDGQQIGTISNLYRSDPDREPVWDAHPFFGLDHDLNSRSQSRDTAIANLVIRALQDGPADPANPSDDVWDTVTVHLAGMTRELPELPESLRNNPEARARYERLTGTVDAFRDQRSPSGDLRDDLVQARDDFAWLRGLLPDTQRGGEQRDVLNDLDARAFWARRLLEGLGGPDSDTERPRAEDEPQGDGTTPSPAVPTPEPVKDPEDTVRPPAEPEPEPDPEPIGGQPAHWARVEDLVPGDMVRMNGTTKNGRPVQRAGYVHQGPVLVDVTRRGRTDQMWRTWVTENPDGTGASGNVYTSVNATAARAEAPDDVVPGSPASGAQAALRSGDLPDQIPTDGGGRGLFPGSTVTSTDDRGGTVTGATDTTVSVHWSDGNDDTAVSPTTVTVTYGQRPDGWTADGHRVTTQSVVSDNDGALLGPVDDVDGDTVTITTADGTITRSAGDLRVTGEVRDDAPEPVTGIDEPAAADLKDGDVVVLDLDGHLATVAITGEPSRDGDRVTLQYADTTTGEMGEIDVDARAVLPRAQGPDGGAPELGPDDAPRPADDLTVHPAPYTVEPVTGPTVDPDLTAGDRDVIGDHADGPEDNPDAHQAAVRITADLPVTPEQASALATQLRAAADPSTLEGRAALRAADHLDRAAGRTPPEGLDRPRPSNAAQVGDGDLVAMPDERRGDQVRVFRIIDAEDGPGGVRSFLLEDQENQQWRRRVVHGAMPVWQLPEAEPDPVTPPDVDDTDTTPDAPTTPATPDTLSSPDEPSVPVARVRPGSLRDGDVIDAPVSRTGYQFNGHRRLTIIGEPQRNGWWTQLTGMDEEGNVHDFGLHNGRTVNVYDRNRPTPALPPVGTPRDPNQVQQADVDRIVSDHARSLAARIIDEATAGTEPPGDIHALREQIAQRLTPEALSDARQATRRHAAAALDAAGITGRDRAAAQRRLRDTREQAHTDTVRAALRTINDLEPLPDESDEDLAARARDLLRLIPDQVAGRPSTTDPDSDPDVTQAVTGHADDAVNALLQQLQAAGVDPGDAERIARILTQHMAGSRQATARRIAARVAAASPDAGRQPGLLARIVALLIRMTKRLAELVKAGARKIAEKYSTARERLARLRAFLGRMVRRVRQWPESRRLARLHRAVNLPDADGESLAARISHWAGLMPEPGRFGQAQQRVTFRRPTTWGRLAAGRLPDRSDRIQWAPDRAADGGPGLTALRHMAALRAAGSDVDQDVTRRLSAALGDDFGDDPHATLQHADDYVATSERRLVNLQAARSGSTIPDDPDLEVEIDAARMELTAARREYAGLRARYAAAVPDAVAAALADIRDMGPEGNAAIVFGPDTNPDAERAVRGVQRLIPRAWLNTPESRRLTAVDGTQGRYEPEGQRITVADLADEGLGTAGHALAQHFARHLGDLDAAQRAFWFTRTHTGRPGARRMRRSALDRLLRRQQTQPETGDSLARSVQAMFNGDWYQDDDLRAFLLGLMATR